MPEQLEPASLCPLPSRPNLEFERKRAKRLVRARGGSIALADAQRIIARDYGFSSWRKLVMYYTHAESLQQNTPQMWQPGGGFDRAVEAILIECRARRALVDQNLDQPKDVNGTAAAAASYIPRFFGLSDAEIFAADMTESEARLIVARRWRFSSWDALITFRESVLPQWTAAFPEAHEGSAIQSLVARPELRRSPSPDAPYDERAWYEILRAFIADRALMHRCIAATGLELQPHLDYALLGRPGWGVSTPFVRGLLDLGANPDWTPASGGATVLEHAIALYKNGEAVDLIAERVRPRRALWISAGLGDVRGMRRFLDRRGRPTDDARAHRLDMVALGSVQFYTGRPDASDTDVLSEAFMVAGLNGRVATMQALLDVGFPVDFVYLRHTMLHIAIDLADVGVVEFLLQHGADPDFKATPDSPSPRDFAHVERAGVTADEAREAIRQRLAVR